MYFVDGLPEKILFEHAGWPREFPEPAGAFGATQVAGGGRFKRNGNRVPPLDGLAGEFAELVAGKYFCGIQAPAQREFAQQVHTIIPVEIRHTLVLVVFFGLPSPCEYCKLGLLRGTWFDIQMPVSGPSRL